MRTHKTTIHIEKNIKTLQSTGLIWAYLTKEFTLDKILNSINLQNFSFKLKFSSMYEKS